MCYHDSARTSCLMSGRNNRDNLVAFSWPTQGTTMYLVPKLPVSEVKTIGASRRLLRESPINQPTTIVHCEANLSSTDDKTANGLFLHSEIKKCELELGLPATDALTKSLDRLVEMTLAALPQLEKTPMVSI